MLQAFLQEQDKHLGGRVAVLRRNENLIPSKKCQLQALRSRPQNSRIAYHEKAKKKKIKGRYESSSEVYALLVKSKSFKPSLTAWFA